MSITNEKIRHLRNLADRHSRGRQSVTMTAQELFEIVKELEVCRAAKKTADVHVRLCAQQREQLAALEARVDYLLEELTTAECSAQGYARAANNWRERHQLATRKRSLAGHLFIWARGWMGRGEG